MAPADANKNIWIAAGDGDLERVKTLIEEQGVSPNAADDVIGYTPMHAAASYGHIHILTYLISKGGDVNITDEEGDTPLYTAESVTVAQFLVEHGALVDVTNSEGVSPIEATEEDFPEVSAYLSSKSSLPPRPQEEQAQVQEHDAVSEELTSELIARTQEIIVRAEREGRDPHDELTALVGRTVLGGMAWAGERDQQQQQEENHDMPER
ncbi:Ankyrin repeat-containing protein P1E11,10 OS=Schizosaccharomyces pombe (strain 972 / ATCC 24843) GN=SPCP1E11.10 PE=4 SV=1 [Rhizoctonia solani AG-1 IB]|uniref:Ankyrin repeat-containing protein P1E11,10 n=1 Tax=Thanatephorus cucumeris (strain AG1-IB / isolate 7/3/14) TaxID=1108050 RepID=A0A0B7FD41_THACB|nr:Ankyrin repeat-containing protein P1E11,10 OS=Schizosaccharomyces pombe (strain 972 / ATCC 24843) GN=SPCP1E11.10 PE=4 SV=1 [Rhizoctonia solani AG-1 IB]